MQRCNAYVFEMSLNNFVLKEDVVKFGYCVGIT